jgi:hypothetical protein
MSSLNAWSCSFLRLDDIVVWYTIIAKVFLQHILGIILKNFNYFYKLSFYWKVNYTGMFQTLHCTEVFSEFCNDQKVSKSDRIYYDNLNNNSSSLPLLTKYSVNQNAWFEAFVALDNFLKQKLVLFDKN